MNERAQTAVPALEQDGGALHGTDRTFDFTRPFFDSRTAAAYVPCKTVKAFYQWRKRHGILPRANGSVAKADLDFALKLRRRAPRRMAAASLANLTKRVG